LELQTALERERERRRVERIRAPLVELAGMLPPIGAVVPKDAKAPRHLMPLAQALTRALYTNERVRFAFSAPPQHVKTSLIQIALGQCFARDPRMRLGYCTYAGTQAVNISKGIREVAMFLGVEMKPDVQAGEFWRTRQHGMLYAGGIEGQWTGKPFDVAVMDDPYSGRSDAESPPYRESVEATLRNLQDRARSIILTHTRWHDEDAIGVKTKDPRWTYVNLPAICETAGDPDSQGRPTTSRRVGDALWPDVKPVEFFEEARQDAYNWSALYQGRPMPRGAKLFARDVMFYDGTLPVGEPVRYAIGFDSAFSTSKRSDWSVIVLMARVRDVFYVVDVWRGQVEADTFRVKLNEFRANYPGINPFSWIGGQEKGVVKLLNQASFADEHSRVIVPGASIVAEAATKQTGDKYVRALPFSTAWNAGYVRIPSKPHPFMGTFVSVLKRFSGVGDAIDDDVDAGAAAYHKLRIGGGEPVVGPPGGIRVWRH
jgi:predicted phage terminase large subunit-like protein